ncbi:hypothetical protein [Dyella jiangningensis]|uniref:Uncharacterized protein n=1 Tax=Dyella jiangningensis TaxID=1379159 RepID=A0A328P446_9GAMM|nr:hypothetical protein [Dyella jiangningensis]RAO75786.1 hypothetical protein CA260_17260 [Dyella jiangningensis]
MDLLAAALLVRPYRPRPEWMEDLNLWWAAVMAAFLLVSAGAAAWRALQRRKQEKHAALDRVRARQRKR